MDNMHEKIAEYVNSEEVKCLDDDLQKAISGADWRFRGSSELVQVQIVRELKRMNTNLAKMMQLQSAQK